jgi:hypothetical protein
LNTTSADAPESSADATKSAKPATDPPESSADATKSAKPTADTGKTPESASDLKATESASNLESAADLESAAVTEVLKALDALIPLDPLISLDTSVALDALDPLVSLNTSGTPFTGWYIGQEAGAKGTLSRLSFHACHPRYYGTNAHDTDHHSQPTG